MFSSTNNKVAVALVVFATIVMISYHHFNNPLLSFVERLAEGLR